MSPILMSSMAVGAISLISLIGLFTLSWKEGFLRRVTFLLISLAAGALLGDAFIHLLPQAFESVSNPLSISLSALAGILAFFVLEKFLHWHHNHGEEEYSPEHNRIHPVGNLVLVSDGVHNLVDGLAIGTAFMISPEVGVATTLAIALHELPQEIGDFGLLIHAGFSRAKALWFNFLSALTAFAGLGLAFTFGEANEALVPFISAFAAGNFIHIACTDLVPELYKTKGGKRSVLQFLVILIGLGVMVALLYIE